MTLLNVLQDEMKAAMRSRDQARLDALRLMVSAIKYAQVDTPDMNDEQITSVLIKEAKKRREAIEAYKKAGRDEAAQQEQYELELIEKYLPKMMSEDDVRAKLTSLFESNKYDNFGVAMGAAMKEVGKSADGGMVSRIVKELFT